MVGNSSGDSVGSLNRARPHLIEMPVLPSDSIVATPSAGSLVAIDCSVPASTQKVIALFAPASSRSTVWSIMTTRSVPVSSSEEHTSELQSLMRISYAVFCLKKNNKQMTHNIIHDTK